MPDIHIQRQHHLGLSGARQVAARWAGQAESEFDMRCTHERGETMDEVRFSRSGVSGTLKVSAERFELQATLGFLLAAFKDRIEGEISKNLDQLLAAAKPARKKKGQNATAPPPALR